MTNKEAYAILDQATQPQNAGRVSREGYAQAQEALGVFMALIEKAEPAPAESEKK